MQPIDGADTISQTRKRWECCICESHEGACIKCSHPNCKKKFHVTCAKKSGYNMKIFKSDPE